MSAVFVDTSAVLAFIDRNDRGHRRAVATFTQVRTERRALRTSSYVLVELYALCARRYGLEVARLLRDDFEPLLTITWVDGALHDAARDAWLRRGGRRSSLVDHVSFEVMRAQGLSEAWAHDDDFVAAGFTLL